VPYPRRQHTTVAIKQASIPHRHICARAKPHSGTANPRGITWRTNNHPKNSQKIPKIPMQAPRPRNTHTAVAIKLTAYLCGYSAHKQKQTAPRVVAATSQPLLSFFCQAFFHLGNYPRAFRGSPEGVTNPLCDVHPKSWTQLKGCIFL